MSDHVSKTIDEDTCPRCGGAGWLRKPVAGKPVAELIQCDCAGEDAKHRYLRRLMESSGMTVAMRERMTFQSFRRDTTPRQQALQAARQFVQRPAGWLLLHGSFGTGKTHLLAAIAQELIRQGTPAYYQLVPELFDKIRATFDDASEDRFDELWQRLLNVDVLLLDDLGAEYPTRWVVERLYTLIDYRYRARLPLVVTTNIPPDKLDGRIGSRLLDVRLTTTVGMPGQDYRTGGTS